MPSPVSSPALRALEDVRRSQTRRGREALGALSAEGERVIRRALDAGWIPRALLVARGHRPENPAVEALCARVEGLGRPWWEVDAAELAQLADGRSSGRLVALLDLPPPRDASRLLVEASPRATFLALSDVRDPGNAGALIRTALASGARAVLTSSGTDPFHPRAVRTSLGAVFKMPLASLPDEGALLDALAQADVCALAAVARGGEPLDSARWPGGRLALVMGNEGVGLSEVVRERADLRISIDLSERADSHCVNSAAAVCLYEIQRRRRLDSRSLLLDGASEGKNGHVSA